MRRVTLAAAIFCCVSPSRALACDAPPCVSSDAHWSSPGAIEWPSLAPARGPRHGELVTGIALQLVRAPLVINVPSPDPLGRDIRLADWIVELTPSVLGALAPGVDVGVAAPLILHQEGAGSAGLTTQQAPPVLPTAPRDPRLTVGWAFLAEDVWAARARLDLAAPLGDARAVATSGGVVLAPGVSFALDASHWHAGTDLSLRAGPATQLADVRWTTSARLALGLRYDLVARWLAPGAEVWAMPALDAESRAPRVSDPTVIPAEWALTVTSQLGRHVGLVGAWGTALPLSSATRQDASGSQSESFAGPGSALWRASLSAWIR